MDKYYVQSGNLRRIVQAETPRKAALWAVHQVMRQILPIDEGSGNETRAEKEDENVLALGGRVRISRRGYDREDARELVTMDVVADWNQMVMTLDRLEKMMYRAA